jgi:hypothetical protein
MTGLAVLLMLALPLAVVVAWARGAWLRVHTTTAEPYYTREDLEEDYRAGRVIDGEVL